jgi:hypothetical protein
MGSAGSAGRVIKNLQKGLKKVAKEGGGFSSVSSASEGGSEVFLIWMKRVQERGVLLHI